MSLKVRTYIYSFFILSGLMKVVIGYVIGNIPIDITLVLGIILTLDMFLMTKLTSVLNTDFLIVLLTVFVFTIYLFFTIIYTASDQYYITKSLKFLTGILAFVYPIIRTVKISSFFKFFTFTTIILAFWYLSLLSNNYLQSSYALSFDEVRNFYLFVSYCTGIVLVILVTGKMSIFRNETLKLIIIILSVLFILLLGGRGPQLFSIFCILLYVINNTRIKRTMKLNRAIILGILTIVLVPTVLLFSNRILLLTSRSISRINTLFTGLSFSDLNLGQSGNERVEHIFFSLEKIIETPFGLFFGHGIGSYGILYNGIDQRLFPHNIILEVTFEGGLIGLAIFIILPFLSFFKNRRDYLVNTYVLIYLLLNQLKSGTLADSRIFFALLSLAIIMNYSKKNARYFGNYS